MFLFTRDIQTQQQIQVVESTLTNNKHLIMYLLSYFFSLSLHLSLLLPKNLKLCNTKSGLPIVHIGGQSYLGHYCNDRIKNLKLLGLVFYKYWSICDGGKRLDGYQDGYLDVLCNPRSPAHTLDRYFFQITSGPEFIFVLFEFE